MVEETRWWVVIDNSCVDGRFVHFAGWERDGVGKSEFSKDLGQRKIGEISQIWYIYKLFGVCFRLSGMSLLEEQFLSTSSISGFQLTLFMVVARTRDIEDEAVVSVTEFLVD